MGILALGLPSFVRTRYRYCTFSASVGMLLLFLVLIFFVMLLSGGVRDTRDRKVRYRPLVS
jgi:hypothetical protein